MEIIILKLGGCIGENACVTSDRKVPLDFEGLPNCHN